MELRVYTVVYSVFTSASSQQVQQMLLEQRSVRPVFVIIFIVQCILNFTLSMRQAAAELIRNQPI